MRKFLLISFLFFVSCSINSINDETITATKESDQLSTELRNKESFEDSLLLDNTFTYINTDLELEIEDISNKKTIIIFWADY
jgi:PBP1b-binding outer membrane lipoprotein LpoB